MPLLQARPAHTPASKGREATAQLAFTAELQPASISSTRVRSLVPVFSTEGKNLLMKSTHRASSPPGGSHRQFRDAPVCRIASDSACEKPYKLTLRPEGIWGQTLQCFIPVWRARDHRNPNNLARFYISAQNQHIHLTRHGPRYHLSVLRASGTLYARSKPLRFLPRYLPIALV